MIAFYPTPDLFDLDGWKRHLDWLRTEPEKIMGRDNAIMMAEMHVETLGQARAQESATQA